MFGMSWWVQRKYESTIIRNMSEERSKIRRLVLRITRSSDLLYNQATGAFARVEFGVRDMIHMILLVVLPCTLPQVLSIER